MRTREIEQVASIIYEYRTYRGQLKTEKDIQEVNKTKGWTFELPDPMPNSWIKCENEKLTTKELNRAMKLANHWCNGNFYIRA